MDEGRDAGGARTGEAGQEQKSPHTQSGGGGGPSWSTRRRQGELRDSFDPLLPRLPEVKAPHGRSWRSQGQSRTSPRPCGGSSTSQPSTSMTTVCSGSPPPSHSFRYTLLHTRTPKSSPSCRISNVWIFLTTSCDPSLPKLGICAGNSPGAV